MQWLHGLHFSINVARREPLEDVRLFVPITKVKKNKDGSRTVYGPCTDGMLDLDEQIVDPEWAAEKLQHWFTDVEKGGFNATIHQMHSPLLAPAGRGKVLDVDEKDGRVYVGAKVVEPTAIKLVDTGIYKGFSIGIIDPPILPTPRARNGRIGVKGGGGWINEVSLVDVPANPRCLYSLVKRAKEGGDLQYTGLVEVTTREGTSVVPHHPIRSVQKAFVNAMRSGDDDAITTALKAFSEPSYSEQARISATYYGLLRRDMDPNVGGGVDRDKLPAKAFVFPQERDFPIVTPGDVEDAVSSWGRYKGPHSFEDFKRRLTRLARRKGEAFVAKLPESWKAQKSTAPATITKANNRKDPPTSTVITKGKCKKCKGTGRLGDVECPKCHGAGMGKGAAEAEVQKDGGASPHPDRGTDVNLSTQLPLQPREGESESHVSAEGAVMKGDGEPEVAKGKKTKPKTELNISTGGGGAGNEATDDDDDDKAAKGPDVTKAATTPHVRTARAVGRSAISIARAIVKSSDPTEDTDRAIADLFAASTTELHIGKVATGGPQDTEPAHDSDYDDPRDMRGTIDEGKAKKVRKRSKKKVVKSKSKKTVKSVDGFDGTIAAPELRLHDYLCPAYGTKATVKAYGDAPVPEVLDPGYFGQRLAALSTGAVKGREDSITAAYQAFAAAQHLATLSPESFVAMRRAAHKAFEDAYPNVNMKPRPTAELMNPENFRRDFLASANSEVGHTTRVPVPALSSSLDAADFRRPAITANEARPTLSGGDSVTGYTGKGATRGAENPNGFYGTSDQSASAMALLHNHIASRHPGVCPLSPVIPGSAIDSDGLMGTPAEMRAQGPGLPSIPSPPGTSVAGTMSAFGKAATAGSRTGSVGETGSSPVPPEWAALIDSRVNAVTKSYGKQVRKLERKLSKQELELQKALRAPDPTLRPMRGTSPLQYAPPAHLDPEKVAEAKASAEQIRALKGRLHSTDSRTAAEAMETLRSLVTPSQYARLAVEDE